MNIEHKGIAWLREDIGADLEHFSGLADVVGARASEIAHASVSALVAAPTLKIGACRGNGGSREDIA